jgi:hypothetical protein
VEIVSKSVEAELRRGTRLIDVAVKDQSPGRVRDRTVAFFEEFQEFNRERNQASADKSRSILEEEAVQQLKRVNIAGEKLQDLRSRYATLNEKNDITITRLEAAFLIPFLLRVAAFGTLRAGCLQLTSLRSVHFRFDSLRLLRPALASFRTELSLSSMSSSVRREPSFGKSGPRFPGAGPRCVS